MAAGFELQNSHSTGGITSPPLLLPPSLFEIEGFEGLEGLELLEFELPELFVQPTTKVNKNIDKNTLIFLFIFFLLF